MPADFGLRSQITVTKIQQKVFSVKTQPDCGLF